MFPPLKRGREEGRETEGEGGREGGRGGGGGVPQRCGGGGTHRNRKIQQERGCGKWAEALKLFFLFLGSLEEGREGKINCDEEEENGGGVGHSQRRRHSALF